MRPTLADVAAKNQTQTSPARRRTFILLCVGSVLAVGCAFGPEWLVRVGLGVALLTAVASVWMTWREMDRMVLQHMGELKALRDEAREAAHAHHVEMMVTIARFTKRQEAYRAQIAEATAEIERLTADVAAVSLDAEAKQTRISALNKIVSDMEKQLSAAEDEVVLAQHVMSLPRRGAGRRTLDVSNIPLVYPSEAGALRQA